MPRPPQRSDDETLDILRRLEPALANTASKDDIAKQFERADERLRKMGEDIAELKGRVSQLPTFVQVAALVFAIFGAAFVLTRFGMPAGH